MDKIKPQAIERRQVNRHSHIHLPKGELTLLYDERPIKVFQFKDVSPFGICLKAAEPVENNTLITIRFHHQHGQFEVYGKMIWQQPDLSEHGSNRHWVGISFEPGRQEQNIALFKLLL